jgi:hypothetical protein
MHEGAAVPQGRRVRRVVRKVDSWTVLRLSFLFCLSMLIIVLVAGVLLWAAATRLGVFGDVSKFMRSIGFENFRFRGGVILRASILGGLVLVVLGSGGSVLAALLYNLVSDVVGGIEVIVLEEEVAPRPVAARPQRPAEGNGEVPAGRVTSIRSGL